MSSIKYNPSFRSLIIGVDTRIPLINGRLVKAINFDNAATTPPLTSVMEEINRFAPWYSSIHRGTGYKSQFSSQLYEQCRALVKDFVKADQKLHEVIFVKNTTEAINKLANRISQPGKKLVVLSTDMEHHSNDLPWRNKSSLEYISLNEQGGLCLEDLERKLRKHKHSSILVTVTGASNVTGYKNPVHKIAALVHQYGGRILVDGAQLIPHAPFDMKPINSPKHIDFLVFSAHKMYAPFGIGVLIGPKSFFEQGEPDYPGGGTVDMVTHQFIRWAEPPHKDEAGSPNIIGVIALAAALETLKQLGMDKIEEHERCLTEYALHCLSTLADVELYVHTKSCHDRVSIIPFNIKGVPHELAAAILSYEGGIAVRNGCFCAQPYVQKLLGISAEEVEKRIKDSSFPHPGMVRLSFGLYNTYEEINTLVYILHSIIRNKKFYIEKYEKIPLPKI